jgi:hypothetical protein
MIDPAQWRYVTTRRPAFRDTPRFWLGPGTANRAHPGAKRDRPAWYQRLFCLAFFSRLGRRDLPFFANFGIFVDFIRGAIWGAGSPAASGATAFFPAPLSAAFEPLAEPPSAPFFLSAISSSRPANFPEIRIRG